MGGSVETQEGCCERRSPLGWLVPALWRVIGGVQIAFDLHLLAAFGKGKEATHGHRRETCVILGHSRTIHEGRPPLFLDVRAPPVSVIWMGMSM